MPLPLPPRTRTDPKEGYVHNRHLETFRTQSQSFTPGVLTSRTTAGTFVRAQRIGKRPAAANSGGQQFRLKDFSWADFFICRTLTANPAWAPTDDDDDAAHRFTEGATDIYIAKPPRLRRTPFDGQSESVTVETWDGSNLNTSNKVYSYDYKSATFRIKTDGAISENEAIIPRFVVDETIYAVPCADLQIRDLLDEPITLLAVSDGRAWASV